MPYLLAEPEKKIKLSKGVLAFLIIVTIVGFITFVGFYLKDSDDRTDQEREQKKQECIQHGGTITEFHPGTKWSCTGARRDR